MQATTDSEESDVESEPEEARVEAIVNEALLNEPDNHDIDNTPQPEILNEQSQILKDFSILIDDESMKVLHHQSEKQTLMLREVLNSVEDIDILKILLNDLSDLKKKC
ncbi:hypothetical protein PRK78_004186 [Emydomyces testavorans]|uniref:Uncharacterized protein n=1 Tax=Emydomyces testavorans TaxID=2070801 RepID=A0AAF0DIB6_9EURO|nr:hypothetical protein PRK78_004186 [Emydomyces testavorans]